jgi:SpoIID/LytB domain protein
VPVSTQLQDATLKRRFRPGLLVTLVVLGSVLQGASPRPLLAVQTPPPSLDPRVALALVALDGTQPASGQRGELLDTPTLPGSVMKAFTLVAALERKIITPTTGALCRRQVTVDGVRYTCAHPDLKRAMTPAEALAHSCNEFFVSLARRLPRAEVNRVRVAAGLPPVPTTTPLAAALVGLDGPRIAPRALAQALTRLAGVGRQTSVSMRDDTRAVLRAGLSGAATYGTAAAFSQQRVPAWAKTGTAPMPGGGVAGLVVALWPAPAPTHSLVALAPGGAGIDVADIAATWLAARVRTSTPSTATGQSAARTVVASERNAPSDKQATIRLGRTLPDGRTRVESLVMDDYVAQVLAGEGQPRAERGAQQALAITARTFAEANRGRHRAEGFDVCDTTHCQVVRASTAVTRDAARVTTGQVLLDRGRAAHVFYSASCGGTPERASHVWPGAPDHDHPHRDDAHAGEAPWTSDVRAADIERALRAAGRKGRLRDLHIVERNTSGRVARLRAEGFVPAEIAGNDFRLALGRIAGWQSLKSTAFEIRRSGTVFRFVGRGFGHGVGLCVVGAGQRAQAGASAREILAFYFPSLSIGALTGTATAHTATAGAPSSVTLPAPPGPAPSAARRGSSTEMEADIRLSLPMDEEGERAELLALVRKARADIARASGISASVVLTVTVHPSVEAFGRATGQPWWVGGATRGQDIALLSPRLLRQRGDVSRTIRHEVAHALLDNQLAGRPLWVREGLAIHFSAVDLAGAGPAASDVAPSRSAVPATPSARGTRARCPTDDELRRPVSAGAQRDAYARAEQCVADALRRGIAWQAIR